MIDWSSVFDEAYPVAGATAADLDRFQATVGKPLSASEIKWINQQQQNPFPKGDPLRASWQPHDPSLWVIPDRPLPPSYLSFLGWSNGGQFRTGRRWFDPFFPALDKVHGVRAMLVAYFLPQWLPGALPFAFDGGGTFYLFDMRRAARRGEYPVVCSHAGNLGWEPDACIQIAKSFQAACRGTVNVRHLW
jgi:hypothetical protein